MKLRNCMTFTMISRLRTKHKASCSLSFRGISHFVSLKSHYVTSVKRFIRSTIRHRKRSKISHSSYPTIMSKRRPEKATSSLPSFITSPCPIFTRPTKQARSETVPNEKKSPKQRKAERRIAATHGIQVITGFGLR